MQPARRWDEINAAGLKEYSNCNHMAVLTVFIRGEGSCFTPTLKCDFPVFGDVGADIIPNKKKGITVVWNLNSFYRRMSAGKHFRSITLNHLQG